MSQDASAAKLLRELRRQRYLSIRNLSDASGLPEYVIRQLEAGQLPIGTGIANALSKAFPATKPSYWLNLNRS